MLIIRRVLAQKNILFSETNCNIFLKWMQQAMIALRTRKDCLIMHWDAAGV